MLRDLLPAMGIQRWRLRVSSESDCPESVSPDVSRETVDLVDADKAVLPPDTGKVAAETVPSSPSIRPVSAETSEDEPLAAEETVSPRVLPAPGTHRVRVAVDQPVSTNSSADYAVGKDSHVSSMIRQAPVATRAADPLDDANWQTLQKIIDQGSLCPTCSVDNAVLGYGNAQANWFFVFDAPTSLDLQGGQLCSGRAGKLFESILQVIGLGREQVYTTSVFKCAPTDDLALNPACHSILRRQIELVQPAVVITFGEFAAQSVLKANESLTQLRQKTQRCFSTQIPVVPTYSPVQMLDDPQLKSLVWSDFKVAIGLHDKLIGG